MTASVTNSNNVLRVSREAACVVVFSVAVVSGVGKLLGPREAIEWLAWSRLSTTLREVSVFGIAAVELAVGLLGFATHGGRVSYRLAAGCFGLLLVIRILGSESVTKPCGCLGAIGGGNTISLILASACCLVSSALSRSSHDVRVDLPTQLSLIAVFMITVAGGSLFRQYQADRILDPLRPHVSLEFACEGSHVIVADSSCPVCQTEIEEFLAKRMATTHSEHELIVVARESDSGAGQWEKALPAGDFGRIADADWWRLVGNRPPRHFVKENGTWHMILE